MNRGFGVLLVLIVLFGFSWTGLVLVPHLQLANQEPAGNPVSAALYPTARSGTAQQGREVYRANGCFYCHTQQVRRWGEEPGELGSDLARGWGNRHTVGRDYIFDNPVMLGHLRLGSDLANIGMRQTNRVWHLMHLYNPRTVVEDSIMPAYPYLFETREVGRQPSPAALDLPEEFAVEEGYEVVPTRQAEALVAYLLSLKADVPLLEAPLAPEME